MSLSFDTFYYPDGQVIPPADILAYGEFGVVILRNDVAIKIPRLIPGNEYISQRNINSLTSEQQIYEHLEGVPGIVPVIRISPGEIHLRYMENGTLEALLKKEHPCARIQLLWFIEIANNISLIHQRRVTLQDLHAGNILMDGAWDPLLCDFGEAKTYPMSTEIKGTGIGIMQFGLLMEEVICNHLEEWSREKLREVLEDDGCPERVKKWFDSGYEGQLTPLENGLEEVMENCISENYDTMNDVAADLRNLLCAHPFD